MNGSGRTRQVVRGIHESDVGERLWKVADLAGSRESYSSRMSEWPRYLRAVVVVVSAGAMSQRP